MAVFSQRNGYGSANIQIEAASQAMKNRIWAAFYKKEFDIYDTLEWDSYTTGIENMMIKMGVPYEFPENRIYKAKNAKALQKYVLEALEWYMIFDFLERYLSISKADTVSEMTAVFNHIWKMKSPVIVSLIKLLCRLLIARKSKQLWARQKHNTNL